MDQDSWHCNHALLACRQSNAANFIQISEETEIGLIDPPPYQEKESNGGGVIASFLDYTSKIETYYANPYFQSMEKKIVERYSNDNKIKPSVLFFCVFE